MTDDEREEIVQRLWDEFTSGPGANFHASNDLKYGFMAGARGAIGTQ